MNDKTQDDIKIESFRTAIKKTCTAADVRKHYMAYSHGSSRSAYIHNSGRIVRVRRSQPEIVKIATDIFGPPNGDASHVNGENLRNCSWFFNGKTTFTGEASKKAIENMATVIGKEASKKAIENMATVIGKNEMKKPNLAAVLIHLHQETTWTPHGDEYRCEYRPNVSVYIRFRESHISISGYPGGTEEFEKFAGVADKDFLKNGKRHQDWIYPGGD